MTLLELIVQWLIALDFFEQNSDPNSLTRQATRQQLLPNPDFTDMLLSPRGFRMRLVGCLTSQRRSDDFCEIYMKRTTCAMKSGLKGRIIIILYDKGFLENYSRELDR
jgi:hypothetical protein